MPRVSTRITDGYESITRPVALGVARQVAELLGLPETIKILYPGDAEETPMHGSTSEKDGNPSKFGNSGQIRIAVTESAVEDRIISTAVFRKENLPIFVDAALGIRLTPVYSGTEMVFDIQYRAPNKVLAKRFRDEALERTAMGRRENYHQLTYHYGLAPAYLIMLKEFHRMREAVAPYNEDFSKWIRDHITPKATNLTTLIGTQQQLVIGETQVCPLGAFDFEAMPEPEDKKDETGAYLVNFQYRLTYDRVMGVMAQWPLVIHNQLVDEAYRDTPNASGVQTDPDRNYRAPSLSRFAFDAFSPIYTSACERKYSAIRIPEYDEWIPAVLHPDTLTVASIMLMVNPADPHEVLDLTALGTYAIQPAILSYMQTEHMHLNTYGNCAAHLSLYLDDTPLADGSLIVDNTLKVRSLAPLQLRSRYHLRIAMIHDMFTLRKSVQDRLRFNGPACREILKDLQFRMIGNAYIPELLGGVQVAYRTFIDLAQRIKDRTVAHNPTVDYQSNTVGNFLIVTHRDSDYANHGTSVLGTAGQGTDPGAGHGTLVSKCDG